MIDSQNIPDSLLTNSMVSIHNLLEIDELIKHRIYAFCCIIMQKQM